MSDTAPKDQDALLSGHVAGPIERTVRHGDEIWRLTKDDRVLTCEIRDACEVVIREAGELMFSLRMESLDLARYAAHRLKQDHLRTRWIESLPLRHDSQPS